MRKITLWFASSVAKSGCGACSRAAPGRPVIVNSACTPPSGVPSRFLMNRASRTGPFAERNGGTRVGRHRLRRKRDLRIHRGTGAADCRLRMAAAAAIEIHPRPRPSATSSASSNSSLPATKYSFC